MTKILAKCEPEDRVVVDHEPTRPCSCTGDCDFAVAADAVVAGDDDDDDRWLTASLITPIQSMSAIYHYFHVSRWKQE